MYSYYCRMYCCSSFLAFLKHTGTYLFTRAEAGAGAGQKKTGAGAGQKKTGAGAGRKWTGSATLAIMEIFAFKVGVGPNGPQQYLIGLI